jgi:hypothetical protein
MSGFGSNLPPVRDMSTVGRSRKNGETVPFSLRLTFEERAALERAAGDMPLGAYIRAELFRGKKVQRRRRYKRPVKDYQALGQLLGELGEARLANNLNQLARAANTGSLPVTPETEKALREACVEVQQMRTLLMNALGFSGKAAGIDPQGLAEGRRAATGRPSAPHRRE